MKPLTAVIVGCGHRSRVYAEIALKCPDQLKIVALVDPDKHVRDMCKELYGVPENMCFDDISQILPMGKIADCVINGTMINFIFLLLYLFWSKDTICCSKSRLRTTWKNYSDYTTL